MKKRNYNLIIGIAITALMAALVVLGRFWTPHDTLAVNAASKFLPPSSVYILGTDYYGRDIFSRLLEGAGTTLFIAAATVAIGAAAGIVLGALTGYYGGALDELLMRVNDTITSFPSILLALVLISLLGQGRNNVIAALAILFVPSFARVARTQFARERELDYVRSARLMGVRGPRIMFVHILPNTMHVMLSAIAIGFNNAVLAEAGMSFLGIGVQPPYPSLGRMLSESRAYFSRAPWYALSVGGAIVLLILGFGLISDGLGANE